MNLYKKYYPIKDYIELYNMSEHDVSKLIHRIKRTRLEMIDYNYAEMHFTLSEVTRILKYFYTVKEPEYYIEKYAEESMKCLDNVAVDLPEESKKIAAYKLFRQNADEDERAGYYLALYGPMAYRKWTEAVGLYSPETERISRILKEICIEKQHCA